MQLRDVQAAAHTLGRELVILSASSDDEIEKALATLAQQRIAALVVTADPFFTNRRAQSSRCWRAMRCPRSINGASSSWTAG